MFEYVVVITSIIIGLALAQLLQGLAQIIQDTRRQTVYWVHLVWVACMFLQAVFWWWWEYRYRETDTWTFQLYFFVLSYAFLVYLACALLFPRNIDDYGSFKIYFYSHRSWFFGVLAAGVLMDLADTWFKGAAYFASLGLQYPLAMCALFVLLVTGSITRNERFHATFAVAGLAYQISWALRMFETLD
jgi:hypothetical protein